jgi:hypothetical protein
MIVSNRLLRLSTGTFPIVLMLCVVAPTCSFATGVPQVETRAVNAIKSFDALPMSFEENQGQADPSVRFLSRGAGFSALFKGTRANLLLSRQVINPKTTGQNMGHGGHSSNGKASVADSLGIRLLHANSAASLSGAMALPGTVNYFVGSDAAKWHTNVPTYAQVKYTEVYPGINLVYYGKAGHLEFDFELAPGADPENIALRFDGSRTLKLDPDGNLLITARNGEISFRKPLEGSALSTDRSD